MGDLQTQSTKNLLESESIIKNSENFIGMGLWNIGNELKYIRDNKTYKQKDYSSFEDYVENQLDYSRMHAYRFIAISDSYSVTSMLQIGHLGMTKLLELKKLEESEREEFIKENPVDEMTTRELQKAIKEKKEADKKAEQLELSNKTLQDSYNELSKKYQKEKNKEPEKIEVEVEIDNTDYTLVKKSEELEKQLKKILNDKNKIETRLELMTDKANAYEQDSLDYKKIKEDITYLTNQKDEIGRQLQAITDISALVVEIDHFIKEKLAPVRYSKSLLEARDDEIVLRNLTDIVETVEQWSTEMRKYIPNKINYVEVI